MLPRHEPPDEWLHLSEVLDDVVANGLDRARLRRRGGVDEEAGEPARQARQVIGCQRAPAEQRFRAVLVRESPHADGVVDDVALGPEPVALRTEPDGNDAEIDVGGQPPVQANLVLAAAPAPLERRVVHEPVVDGALELPDFPIGEEDPGDVCGDQRDLGGSRDRIGLRAPEVIEERPDLAVPRHGHVQRARTLTQLPSVGFGRRARWTASRNVALEKGLAR